MTAIDLTLVVVDLIVWALLLVLHSLRPAGSRLSAGELQRRVEAGDQTAQYEVRRQKLLPRIYGAKWLLESLFMVIVVVLTVLVFDHFGGALLSFLAVAMLEPVTRVSSMEQFGRKLLHRYEPALLKKVEQTSWLALFSRTDESRSLRVGSREELADLISHISPQILPRSDRETLLSELEFSNKTVADVMTPRTMIDTVSIDDTIGPLLLDRLHRTGHSRFPVIQEDVDHVVGMLYLHELIGGKSVPSKVKQAMHGEVYFVGEGRDLEHALHAFLQSHHHLFIVVNEYRETVGILSLEDVIEALIGRSIVDEFDTFDDLRAVASTNPKSNNAAKGKKDI
jgi:CBS domain containing-hemolysin-like protein